MVSCCQCETKSYYVDILNPQANNIYMGGCLNCGNKMDLRLCDNCENYYFPDFIENEIISNEKYYCSEDCFEISKNE
jgi:hypothetical protein